MNKKLNRFDIQKKKKSGEKAVWISDGDDHYFMAAIYLFVAQKMVEDGLNIVPITAASGKNLIGKVRMRTESEKVPGKR